MNKLGDSQYQTPPVPQPPAETDEQIALESNPNGALLPKDQARQEWYELGQAVAKALHAELLGYSPGLLLKLPGYVGGIELNVDVALAIRSLVARLTDAEAAVKNLCSLGPRLADMTRRAEKAEGEQEWNGHTAKEWSLALQSLTPQGSEFATSPQACVEYVRREMAAGHEARIQKVKAERGVASANIAYGEEHQRRLKAERELAEARENISELMFASAVRAERAVRAEARESEERAKREAAEANRQAEQDMVKVMHERAVAAETERDAYKRAKAENDDRFMGERDDARAEVERLKQSMADHFTRDHLAGDGPEIDRWKREVERLKQALTYERDEYEQYRAAHPHSLMQLAGEMAEALRKLLSYTEQVEQLAYDATEHLKKAPVVRVVEALLSRWQAEQAKDG